MDVTKPVLCVSSLKDLTLSELIEWVEEYRQQVVAWEEESTGDSIMDYHLEILAYNLGDVLNTLVVMRKRGSEVLGV